VYTAYVHFSQMKFNEVMKISIYTIPRTYFQTFQWEFIFILFSDGGTCVPWHNGQSKSDVK